VLRNICHRNNLNGPFYDPQLFWPTSHRARQVGLGVGLHMTGDAPNFVLVPKKLRIVKGPMRTDGQLLRITAF
jgi:hypothetical protein